MFPKRWSVLVGVLAGAVPALGQIDLSGTWQVDGNDVQHPYMHWSGQFLLTQGPAVGTRHPMQGTVYWTGTNGAVPGMVWGWEDFQDGANGTQSYFDSATLRVRLQGYRLREAGSTAATFQLAMTTYQADITCNGNWMLNGSWGDPAIPGAWQAYRIADCNTNGIADVLDISAGRSIDGNSNCIPDECEVTCSDPLMTLQPADATVCEGDSVTFTAAADGDPTPQFQWRLDGVDIPGATGESFTIPAVAPTDAGQYVVVATNDCDSILSQTATLIVQVAPVITADLTDLTACLGRSAALAVTVNGSEPLAYYWRRDGIELLGESGPTLVLDPVGPGDAGNYDLTVTNACGTAWSAVAAVTVEQPVGVTLQPVGQRVCAGEAVSFSVDAEGAEPIAFQWRHDGAPIPGATADTIIIDPVGGGDAGNYTVVISNVCGSVTSDVARLDVTIGPALIDGPADLTICEGSLARFEVAVNGSQPLAYQWQKDGVDIPGATANPHTVSPAAVGSAGVYTVTVSNSCGTATGAAVLTVQTAPRILVQPSTQSACDGGTTSFTVVAEGTPPLSYQWQRNSVSISGATGQTLTIDPVTHGAAGTYRVVVRNACGFVTSSNAALLVNDPPVITRQPVGASACIGEAVSFSVGASGTPTLRYQWQKDGIDIPGATRSDFTLNPLEAGDNGAYTVLVRNACGQVLSLPAMLEFDAGQLRIVDHPLSQVLCAADRLALSITADGAPPPVFQWRKNGVSIPGETAGTFVIESVVDLDGGTYDVEVRNGCGSLISDAATVVVWPRGSADINGDGDINGLDIVAFADILVRGPSGAAGLAFCGSDMNGDGQVTVEDIPAFLAILIAP